MRAAPATCRAIERANGALVIDGGQHEVGGRLARPQWSPLLVVHAGLLDQPTKWLSHGSWFDHEESLGNECGTKDYSA
jgi:hypothetical protein